MTGSERDASLSKVSSFEKFERVVSHGIVVDTGVNSYDIVDAYWFPGKLSCRPSPAKRAKEWRLSTRPFQQPDPSTSRIGLVNRRLPSSFQISGIILLNLFGCVVGVIDLRRKVVVARSGRP